MRIIGQLTEVIVDLLPVYIGLARKEGKKE
jgi:hypothetical protein